MHCYREAQLSMVYYTQHRFEGSPGDKRPATSLHPWVLHSWPQEVHWCWREPQRSKRVQQHHQRSSLPNSPWSCKIHAGSSKICHRSNLYSSLTDLLSWSSTDTWYLQPPVQFARGSNQGAWPHPGCYGKWSSRWSILQPVHDHLPAAHPP